MQGDHIIHAVAKDGAIRAMAAVTTESVEEARWRHDMYPTAAAAFGRTMTGAAMLGAMLKQQGHVLVQVIADGPLKSIVTDANSSGDVRGYVSNPRVHLPLNRRGKLDVGGAVGKGHFYVTRDMAMKDPYRSSIPLVSGEIGEDFAYYFLHSEQTPSVVSLGVLVDTDNSVRAAGGFIVQLMPGAEETLITQLEARFAAFPAVSRLIDEGKPPLELLTTILEGWNFRVLENKPIRFLCTCSRQRFSQGLIALGSEELRELIQDQGNAELTCHFCREVYRFSEEDLEELVREIEEPPQ